MNLNLLQAIDDLTITANEKAENFIDDKLGNIKPRKRAKHDSHALRQSIESDFLSPPTSFGPDWLNRLQQYVVPSAPSILLTTYAGDGKFHMITMGSMSLRRLRRGLLFALPGRVSTAESLITKKSRYLPTAPLPKTLLRCLENRPTVPISYVVLLVSFLLRLAVLTASLR